jgi:hypothetical protein
LRPALTSSFQAGAPVQAASVDQDKAGVGFREWRLTLPNLWGDNVIVWMPHSI